MLLAEKLSILCFLTLILLEGVPQSNALVRRYRFELRNTSITKLCTTKSILTINGQYPGPTIYARRGDLVIVDVINLSDHNITIHWHGVKMPRYPWSDGPLYVTQCPITPGNRFTQRVILSDEEGTLWWHAHSNWIRNTVYGALVILPPKTETYPFPKPHAEVAILIGEWWNEDVDKVYADFLHSGTDPEPSNAFLFNGLPGELFPCSTQDIFKLRVEFGKTYLIRMIGAVMDYVMYFRIANHNMTVVGSDGAYTKPLNTDYIVIPPGQTIDFLVEANQQPSLYYMATTLKLRGVDHVEIPTTGYIEYVGNYTPPSSPALPSFPDHKNSGPILNFISQLRSLANTKYPIDVPKNVTDNLFYTLAVNLRPCIYEECLAYDGKRLLASINNFTSALPTIPFLDAYYYNISGVYNTSFPDNPPSPYNYTQPFLPKYMGIPQDDGTAAKILEYNSTVELVFQSTSLGGGIDHPMHLHGHSFYVVGTGFGNFNRSTDPAKYNVIDPPLMETVVVPRGGWLAIRFKANNPGVWYLHCHLERHQSWGMGVPFIVMDGKLPNEKMLPPPPDMPRCYRRTSNTIQSPQKIDVF